MAYRELPAFRQPRLDAPVRIAVRGLPRNGRPYLVVLFQRDYITRRLSWLAQQRFRVLIDIEACSLKCEPIQDDAPPPTGTYHVLRPQGARRNSGYMFAVTGLILPDQPRHAAMAARPKVEKLNPNDRATLYVPIPKSWLEPVNK